MAQSSQARDDQGKGFEFHLLDMFMAREWRRRSKGVRRVRRPVSSVERRCQKNYCRMN
jgi:hypothetical protein